MPNERVPPDAVIHGCLSNQRHTWEATVKDTLDRPHATWLGIPAGLASAILQRCNETVEHSRVR